MPKFASFRHALPAIVLSFVALPLLGSAQGADQKAIPNFSLLNEGWIAINSDFVPVGTGPKPVVFDPKYPFRRNDEPGQATYRVADVSNPNLKPWAVEELKRYNEKVFAGQIGTTPRWSCRKRSR